MPETREDQGAVWEPREGPEYSESGPALEPYEIEAKKAAAEEEEKAAAKTSQKSST